jgi:hypothetical protein
MACRCMRLVGHRSRAKSGECVRRDSRSYLVLPELNTHRVESRNHFGPRQPNLAYLGAQTVAHH